MLSESCNCCLHCFMWAAMLLSGHVGSSGVLTGAVGDVTINGVGMAIVLMGLLAGFVAVLVFTLGGAKGTLRFG